MVNAAEAAHRKETMTVLFSLELPADKQAEVEAMVARGEAMAPAELQKRYSVGPEDRKALVTWLKGQGYQVDHVSADGASVYARATVDKIAKSLEVNMVRVTRDGITYNAAQNAPSLPAEVGKNVHAIIGLQPFRHANKHSPRCLPLHGNRASLAPGTSARKGKTGSAGKASKKKGAQPSPNIKNAPPYLVSEILKSYGADKLSVTGKGQTIAILIDTFPANADLKAFWKRNGIKRTGSSVQKINVNGGPLPPAEGEETLDAEWASGIAPGATVRIYASGSLRFVDLDLALDRIIADLAT